MQAKQDIVKEVYVTWGGPLQLWGVSYHGIAVSPRSFEVKDRRLPVGKGSLLEQGGGGGVTPSTSTRDQGRDEGQAGQVQICKFGTGQTKIIGSIRKCAYRSGAQDLTLQRQE